MVAINNQGNFDGLRLNNQANYVDTGISAFGTGNIVAPAGIFYQTPAIEAGTADSGNFTGDNMMINFTEPAGNASRHWARGEFRARNSILSFSAAGNHQWPGWTNTGVNNRYTVDLQNARINVLNHGTAPAAGGTTNVDNTWTFHLAGAAVTGNNLSGLVFGDRVAPFIIYGSAELIGLTFGAGAAASGGQDSNFRFDKAQNLFDNDAISTRWDGFFECNCSGWTTEANQNNMNNTINPNHQNGSQISYTVSDTEGAPGMPIVFFYGNTYPDAMIGTGGNTGVGLRVRFRSTDIAMDMSVGQLFNPQFRDSGNFAEVPDVKVDMRAHRLYLCLATNSATKKDTHLTRVEAGADQGIRTVSTDSGYMVEFERTNAPRNATTTFRVPGGNIAGNTTRLQTAADPFNFWSYTHQCYTNRQVNEIQATDSTFRSTDPTVAPAAGVFPDGSEQNQDIASEAEFLPTAVDTVAKARTLNTSTGTNTYGNVYGMLKAVAFDDELIQFNVVPNGTVLDFGSTNVLLSSSDTNLDNSKDQYDFRTTSDNFITGDDTFNTLNGTATFTNDTGTSKELRNQTINISTLNMNNFTVGSGLTIGSTTVNAWRRTTTAATLEGAKTITLDASALSEGDIVLASDLLGIDSPAGTGTITIRPPVNVSGTIRIVGVPGSSDVRLVGGTNGTGTITIEQIPADVFSYQISSGILGGRWSIRNKTRDNYIVAPTTVTSGTAETFNLTNDSTTGGLQNGDVIGVYYKPTNNYSTNQWYYVSEFEFVFNSSLSANTPITPALAPYPTAVVSNTEYTGASVSVSAGTASETFTLFGATTSQTGEGVLYVDITDADAEGNDLSGLATNNLLHRATDTAEFFQWYCDNEISGFQPFNARTGSVAVLDSRVILRSAEDQDIQFLQGIEPRISTNRVSRSRFGTSRAPSVVINRNQDVEFPQLIEAGGESARQWGDSIGLTEENLHGIGVLNGDFKLPDGTVVYGPPNRSS